jgi:hypothetical protein
LRTFSKVSSAYMREGHVIGIAVILTPIAPVIATVIGSGAIVDPDRRIAAGIVLVGYPIALIVTAFLGLPAFTAARRKNLLRWWTAPLLGVPIGLLIVTPVALSVSPESDAIRIWANSAALGSLSLFVFWLIWRTLTTKFTDGGEATMVQP